MSTLKPFLFSTALVLATATTLSAQAAHPRREIRHDRREVVADRREVRQDRREAVGDRHEIRHDRREIAKAHAAGDAAAVVAGRHELRSDARELKRDERETRSDSRDARQDVRDLRHDRRDLRHQYTISSTRTLEAPPRPKEPRRGGASFSFFGFTREWSSRILYTR
jgi:hypothetical protein